MRSEVRKAIRRPSGRVTNLTLLAALILALLTGLGALATGSAAGRWVVLGHGIVGLAVLLLTPWKSVVVRRGLRRTGTSRWISVLLGVLVAISIGTGLASSTGLARSIGGQHTMWVHIAASVALLPLLPLLVWHVVVRRPRPRAVDLSRRTLLRTGALGVTAAALYGVVEATTRLADWPGSRRRFTGSHEIGSFDPTSMPSTIWLNDTVPHIVGDQWRLEVTDASSLRSFTLADLPNARVTRRATLDCTSGWFAQQDWTGVPVAALLDDVGAARSLRVQSVTGYWIRFPIEDVDSLLLATGVGGAPLARRHGFPARLVAPRRRGFWWVKWVERIEVDDAPPWWQPPFPLA